jgi:hypothetical protein
LETSERGRSGGPSSLPSTALALFACVVLLGPVACDGDTRERATPRASGRVIDEPFADLFVVAGKRGAGRLFAMDLLNLELQPLAKRNDLHAIVAVCSDGPVVRAGEARTLLILENDALVGVPEGVLEGDDCWMSGADGRSRGWRQLARSPNGERVLVAKGRRVAVSPVGGGGVEELGRTRLPLIGAIWARR